MTQNAFAAEKEQFAVDLLRPKARYLAPYN